MGIGDWGLGIGDWGLGPIPNPQSPIPNPQSPIILFNIKNLKNKYNNLDLSYFLSIKIKKINKLEIIIKLLFSFFIFRFE